MKIKKVLFLLVIVDVLLFIQVFASSNSTHSKENKSIHQNLNAFVNSKGFKKYKNDHFPIISGEVDAVITIQNRAIVDVQIEKTSIKNKQFLSAFTNFLLCQKLLNETKFGEFNHRFSINRH